MPFVAGRLYFLANVLIGLYIHYLSNAINVPHQGTPRLVVDRDLVNRYAMTLM